MPWCWSVCFWWGTSWPDQALWPWVPWGIGFVVGRECPLQVPLSLSAVSSLHVCSVVLWFNAALGYTSSWSPHGSCAGSNLWVMWSCFTTCQIYERKVYFYFFLMAKLLSLMKEEWRGGRGQLQRECTGKAVLSFGVKSRFLCISGYKPW